MLEQTVNVAIADLVDAVRIINTAIERSAFKGNELSTVGRVHDNFSSAVRTAKQDDGGSGEPDAGDGAEILAHHKEVPPPDKVAENHWLPEKEEPRGTEISDSNPFPFPPVSERV